MILEIIDSINGQIKSIHNEEAIYGIAQRVYRINSDETIDFLPGIVDKYGEARYVGLDDIESLTIYHKVNSSSFSFAQRGGYGDARRNEDTIACSLIAIWDARKINVYSSDMALLLRSRMPQQIRDVPGVNLVTIAPVGAVLNNKQVFDSEYAFDKNYLLPIYISFIQLNYTVQVRYDDTCIEKCINC